MFPPPRDRIKRRRSFRHSKAMIAVCAVLVIALCLGVYFIFFAGGSGEVSARQLRFSASDMYCTTDSSIYFIQDAQLTCIDYADNEKWRTELLAANMKVTASSTLVAAYDNTKVQMFTYNGEPLSSKEFYGTVSQVRCGKTLTAVLNTDYENSNRVIVLDSTGKEVTRYEFSGKYILDFGFYTDDSLYIYTLDSGSVVPVSRVMTYSDTQANTGNLAIESQLLQHILFLSDSLYAVGTNQIIQMDYIGTRMNEKLIYGWEYADALTSRNNTPTILMVPGGERSGQQMISTARVLVLGASDVFVQMPSATIEVSLGSDKLYAYTANMIRTISLSGETLSERALPFEATGFVPLSTKKHALAFAGETVYMINLP